VRLINAEWLINPLPSSDICRYSVDGLIHEVMAGGFIPGVARDNHRRASGTGAPEYRADRAFQHE